MKKNIIKIRIIFWTILVIIVFALFWFAVVPIGRVSYLTDFCKSSEFIGVLTPTERLDGDSGCVQKIIGDPVYFSLRTPRTFDKATMEIKYRTSENYPGVIEIGNLVDNIVWRYDLGPIENEAINKLSLVWDAIQEEEIMLLQRDKKYNNIQDFLDEIEKEDSEINIDELLLYNYDLQKEYILKDYVSSEENNSIVIPLRGSYQFYTYIKDEDLKFDFSIIDLNQNRDKDSIEVLVFYEDQVIESVELEDDGNNKDDSVMSLERNLNLNSVNLPEGVYKIEIKANNDIITTNIETKQSKLSFMNKLWIYNNDDDIENIDLYTNSNHLQFNTASPESLQTVTVNDKDIAIEETYSQYAVNVLRASSTELSKIYLERDGIIVSGNGLFSFNEENYFNPVIKKFDSNVDINNENINFVLADYKIPDVEGEWRIVTQEFNLKDSYREFYKYGFIISVPGLDSEDDINDWVEIDKIIFNLEGRGLFEKLKEILGF